MTIALTILGITLPAVAATAAVRRWIAPVPWRIALLYLALTFGFLHGAVFTNQLPVPVDEVARGYPWRGVVDPGQPKNPLTNDTVRLFLPWMKVAREELFAGRAPLWNRYSFGGYPLLANGEAAPFSPLFLATLVVPLPKQIVAMAGLKLFLALLFGYLFVKREGASDAAASFAAIAFAFSSFQTVFLYYSTVSVTALLPAALFALFDALERPRKAAVVLVALVVASLMANGHPESVFHIALGAFVLMAIDLAFAAGRREWLRRFRHPVFGALLGLALSAPAWVPVLEQVRLSARLAELAARGGHAPIPVTAAWAIVSPNGFGNPVRHNYDWWVNYSSVASSFIGLVTLACALAAAISRGTPARDRVRLGAAVVMFLFAMQWTAAGRLFGALPGMSITANDKLRFVVGFVAAVVAAHWLDRRRGAVAYVACAAVIGGLALYVYRVRAAYLQAIDLVGVVALAVVAVTLLVPRLRRSLPAVAAAATVAELFTLNAGFNALVDGRFYRPELPIMRVLHASAPAEPFRVVGHEWMLSPNASAEYGLEDIRGSDPMAYGSYVEYLRAITVDDPSMDFDRVTNVESAVLDFLNVRFLMAEPGSAFSTKWKPLYSGPDGVLFANTAARARFFTDEPGAAVMGLRAEAPGRFTMRVEAPRLVVVTSSLPAGPGWVVRADGRRIAVERHQGAFLSFRRPAGSHSVHVTYRPLSFYGSIPVAIAAAILLILQKSWNRTYP